MVLSNAERQARYIQRLKAKVDQGVTPEMVRRAIRIMYGVWMADVGEKPDWPAFVAVCRTQTGARRWLDMAPDSAEPENYCDELSAEDRDLLVKVGAFVRALKYPPEA